MIKILFSSIFFSMIAQVSNASLPIELKSIDASIRIIGACKEEPIIDEYFSGLPSNYTVGDLTIFFLKKNSVPYKGSENSIQRIYDLPSEYNELIVISDEEMLAYGWCYKVNNFVPEEYPNKVTLTNEDEVTWYFAFSHYLKGKWISQCVPSYTEPRSEFCE